jgi:hypothetical protein
MGAWRQCVVVVIVTAGLCWWFKAPPHVTAVIMMCSLTPFLILGISVEQDRETELQMALRGLDALTPSKQRARFVGIRDKPFFPSGPGFGLPRITLSPPVYIQRVMQTIQDALPNKNRSLARIIAEYALSVHIVYYCRDIDAIGICYYGLDETMADDYVQPGALPVDKHDKFSPVYWNAADARWQRTKWYEKDRQLTSGEYVYYREWLLRVEGAVHQQLLV